MWILALKGLTLPVAHLHHITSLSAQSTTFKEAHKDFHLSIQNMNFLSLNGLVISFLYNLELPTKYATQSGIRIFLTTKTIALQKLLLHIVHIESCHCLTASWSFAFKPDRACFQLNHNYNKIVKSDWLSTALISALIGQFDRTVCVMPK